MVGKSESDGEKPLDLFLKIGLDERTANNTVANNKVTANLTAVIHEELTSSEKTQHMLYGLARGLMGSVDFWAAVTDGCDRTVGNLLYSVATKFPTNALVHRPTLLKYIVSSKIKTPAQLEAAFSFLSATASDDLKIDDFEAACGVGVEVSLEDIERAVDEIFEKTKLLLWSSVGELFGYVRKKQPWADPKIVKQIIDTKLYALLGERTAADNEKPVKKKKEKPAKAEVIVEETAPAKLSEEEINPFSIFPSPEQNFKVHTEIYFSDRPVLRACNSKEILDKHLKVTGGKVFTRFHLNPMGYVCGLWSSKRERWMLLPELGKIKSYPCLLNLVVIYRYDDTNQKLKRRNTLITLKKLLVGWGGNPLSDYFQELYELAVELIRRGHAYVDHQVDTDEKEYREKKMNSPWRDRPIEESLKLFDDMKNGLIEEGKATLRMKQDMQSDNFNMYDLIAYRIKFTPHPHAGDKWCIYPSYDYAHCIVDSLENVTHSLCTLEFETRRASYYWLLDALGLYQPYVWEYSRLNVTNTVMSKRKLNRLVTEKWVNGWDDPSLAGLRRRGVTATSINAFVRGIGITRSDSSMIRLDRLEYHIREELNKTAPRTMVVLNPLKVVITNMDSSVMDLDAKKWPEAPADDASSFYKGVLHWVAEASPGVNPLKVEVRLFDKLFLSENPAELDDWLGDLNPNSKVVITDAYAVPSLKNAAVGDKFQFERLGYFAVDKDSLPGKLVFNRTVTLRDSYSKGGK
ncbi:Glutamine--tRNA ligase, cytoplasmic [Sesamum angolense]|uniref:glutamine--tRNA ligase n=1 Tax=Sesamum angolense TaxID=2727404 RepID=A0AAE1XDX3_9LAMI|nr:Glutamine--tRNA ligase, cytoplasmic [Sesamum angolense]